MYGINGKQLLRHYRYHLSAFKTWDQRPHARNWLLYPKNMGTHLSIDETSLSDGELYTILTNKAAKGQKGSIIAIMRVQNLKQSLKFFRKSPKKLVRK